MGKSFGSKWLVNNLHKFGFSISSDKVNRYKHSAVEASAVSNNDLEQQNNFVQWIADNVDHNLVTLTGKGTFHGMGVISASAITNHGMGVISASAITNHGMGDISASAITNHGMGVISASAITNHGMGVISASAITNHGMGVISASAITNIKMSTVKRSAIRQKAADSAKDQGIPIHLWQMIPILR